MTQKTGPRKELSVGAEDVVTYDCTRWLDADASGTLTELLTGTPTVTSLGPSGLTISNKAVNTSALYMLNNTVAVGAAIQFKVSGQERGKVYQILLQCYTNATVPRKISKIIEIKGV